MAIREVSLEGKDFELSYEIVRPSIENKILFLHGWGANKEIMRGAFGNLFEDFGLLFLDLPGFGASSNNYVLNTNDYANIVKKFLDEIGVSPFAIVGHSYGGKVASIINPPRLALLGSSGIILPKPFSVKLKIALSKIAKAIGLSSSLRTIFASDDAKNMSKEMYETFKIVVDEDFAPVFEKVSSKTSLVWGKQDSASPVIAGQKINELIKNSKLFLIDGNHFFFITNQKATQDFILNGWKWVGGI